MIYSILLISKGGVPIYKKVLRRLPIPSEKFDEESLVASIITAVIGMSQEVFGQKISSFSLENLEVSIGASEKAIVAVISDKGDEEAVKMGKAILSKIDTLLDFPDFEDGLVLSTATDRVEEFINSIVKEIGSPITKSMSIIEDFLLVCERDGIYKRLNKMKVDYFNPTGSVIGSLRARIGGKEKELVEQAVKSAISLNFEDSLNKLANAFSNSYWGNMAKLLFVKLGLIMYTVTDITKVPTIDYLNNVIGDIKIEQLKEKGDLEGYSKLSLLRDYLYRQLSSMRDEGGFQTEVAYFQANKSRFREILLKSESELERKLITLFITPLNSSLATLKLLNKSWRELSSYFLESWFSIDKFMSRRTITIWDELYGVLSDLTRYFYAMKRWNIHAASLIIPLFIQVLAETRNISEVDITYLKDQISRLLEVWDQEIYDKLTDGVVQLSSLFEAAAMGALLIGILDWITVEKEKTGIRSLFSEKILKLVERGVRCYASKRVYPETVLTYLPIVIYNVSTVCKKNPDCLAHVTELIELFNEEIKNKVAKGEEFTVAETKSLGFVMASIKNYTEVIKSIMDREKLLSAGSETLEYIRTRLKALKMERDAEIFVAPVIEFYSSLISQTKEKSLADLVLLRSISMAEEINGVSLNNYLVNKSVLEVFRRYLQKFGPMVPRWQKPLKVCDHTVEILRKLKAPESLVAEIWSNCSDIRKIVNQ